MDILHTQYLTSPALTEPASQQQQQQQDAQLGEDAAAVAAVTDAQKKLKGEQLQGGQQECSAGPGSIRVSAQKIKNKGKMQKIKLEGELLQGWGQQSAAPAQARFE